MLVQLLAGEPELLGDHLGADALVELEVVVPLTDQGPVRLPEFAARKSRAHRDAGHRLHTAGDGDVVLAGDDTRRDLVDGLLGGTALAVDGQTWDVLRQPAASTE